MPSWGSRAADDAHFSRDVGITLSKTPTLTGVERFTQGRHGIGEIGLLNEGVGPERRHQLVLADELSRSIDELD